jgi:hypothetical protein
VRRRLIFIALFAALLLSALAPIRSYDYFWHLATGRWIVEHRALPATDPFAIGSDPTPWINGEWLFEIVLYAMHAIGGATGVTWLRAAFVALLFCVIVVRTSKQVTDGGGEAAALVLTAVAFAGALPFLDARPSLLAPLFVVLALTTRGAIGQAILAALWINIHPSALLAPGIALLSTRRVAPVIASALALLINPHGWRAIAAPVELMLYVRGGTFVNAEWLPSSPARFPLLYLTLIGAAILLATAERPREQWWRIALACGFGYLAVSSVRHQPLWFAAMPIVVAPVLRYHVKPRLAYAASALVIAFAAFTTPKGIGLTPSRFPVEATARLQATGLRGNIYNADQFGGYLIWSFYPERRVLTDGRNELYHTLLPEYAKARVDSRAWNALLRKYRIDLAVDEHRPPLDVMDMTTGQSRKMPASLAYWPPREWALIARDGVAMVFARRAAFRDVERWEIAR